MNGLEVILYVINGIMKIVSSVFFSLRDIYIPTTNINLFHIVQLLLFVSVLRLLINMNMGSLGGAFVDKAKNTVNKTEKTATSIITKGLK